jgi:ABC-type sugar transport system permease subunit
MNLPKRLLRIVAISFVVVVAVALRLRAVERLPQDYDEPVYFLAGQHYARAMLQGDWGELLRYEYNLEHPPLAKLVYGLTLSRLPQIPEIPEQPTNPPPPRPYPLPQPQFMAVRLTAALLGVFQVLILALLNPVAGLFLAVHTFTIKYTSQAYLEALPSLTSVVAVVTYAASKQKRKGWLAISAAALGLTAAAKYLYVVAGLAIAVHWLWITYPTSPRTAKALARWLAPVALWGILAMAVFVLADPFLWPAPLQRLKASILFNTAFSQSAHVREAGLPVWQPFVWLLMSVPWHPGVFLVVVDVLITILALLGVRRLWRERSVFVVWLAIGIAFLLVWPTRWPQYILVLTAPLCLAAAVGLRSSVWEPLAGWLGHVRAGRQSIRRLAVPCTWREARRALLWLLPGVVILSLIALFPMVYQGAMSLTDFGATAIKDGLNGGVWREVWRGLTGQVEPVAVDLFSASRPSSKQVHYAGPTALLQLFMGAGAGVVVYEVIWTVLAVSLQVALGLSVASMLHRPGVRFKGWWRAVFILPWAIPEFVGALIWAQIFEPRFGWLNLAGASFAQRIDIPVPLSLIARWQEDPQVALLVLLVAATWYGFPFMMLAATAGLKLVPGEVYDAAAIDGAGRWQQFRRITWPLLLPLLLPAVIIRAIFTFNQFYLYYVMQTPFPATTFAITSFFFFNYSGQYAVSAAINLFTVAVLILLILWFDRQSKAAEGVTYA